MPELAVSDESLLIDAGHGDIDAFSRIVERNQTWAWRIAWRFTGNEAESSDIVQEAFLRLLEASGRYRPTAGFQTYFYQIISRLCLDYAKRKKPLLFETVPDTPDPSPGAATGMIQQENAIAVRSALDRLVPNQRLAIVLRYYENLGYEEIAKAMEITAKAVERLLARGRERLRGLLGGRNNFFNF